MMRCVDLTTPVAQDGQLLSSTVAQAFALHHLNEETRKKSLNEEVNPDYGYEEARMSYSTMQDADRRRHRESSCSDSSAPDSDWSEQENLMELFEECGRKANEALRQSIQAQTALKELRRALEIVAKALEAKENSLKERKEKLEKKREALNSIRVTKTRQLLKQIGKITKETNETVEKKRKLFFENVDWSSFEQIKLDGEAESLEEEEIGKEEAELKKWKEEMEEKEKDRKELNEKMKSLLHDYSSYCQKRTAIGSKLMEMMEPSAKRFKVSKEDELTSSEKSDPSFVDSFLVANNKKEGPDAAKKVGKDEATKKKGTSIVAAPKLCEDSVTQPLSAKNCNLATSNAENPKGAPVFPTVEKAPKVDPSIDSSITFLQYTLSKVGGASGVSRSLHKTMEPISYCETVVWPHLTTDYNCVRMPERFPHRPDYHPQGRNNQSSGQSALASTSEPAATAMDELEQEISGELATNSEARQLEYALQFIASHEAASNVPSTSGPGPSSTTKTSKSTRKTEPKAKPDPSGRVLRSAKNPK
ncbi:unnamed protein product [Caenorhabditis brenneri]